MKKAMFTLVLIILLVLPASLAAAPNFPVKPVEVVVGFAAGGGTHLAAELLTLEATTYLGQPIQVTCKPGAGGAIGATYVAAEIGRAHV